MPYIAREDRAKFDAVLDKLPVIETKGELEYCAYKLMLAFMETKQYRYTPLHDAVYALVHAAHEFERRFLDMREDDAMRLNGDMKRPVRTKEASSCE